MNSTDPSVPIVPVASVAPVAPSVTGIPQSPDMYPQQPNMYPQQPNMYPQQPYVVAQQPMDMYPTTPSDCNVVVTDEMRDMFGYATAVRILAILECISYALSIFGLIFIYFPLCGMNIVKKWDKSEAHIYAIWKLIGFICCCVMSVFSIFSLNIIMIIMMLIPTIISGLIWNPANKVYKLLQKQTAVPQQLVQAYATESAPFDYQQITSQIK